MRYASCIALFVALGTAAAAMPAVAADRGWARPPPPSGRVYFDHAQVLHSRPVYESAATAEAPACRPAGPAPAQCGDVRAQTTGGLADALRMELPERALCPVSPPVRRELRGYEVTYRYRGRTYTRVMSYDPGSSVRVRVQAIAR